MYICVATTPANQKITYTNKHLIMKKKLHQGVIATLYTVLSIFYAKAQERPFAEVLQSKFTIRGDIALIGNSALSISGRRLNFEGRYGDVRFAPNDDFNELGENGGQNMNYIDIDNDSSTVSSSSADLVLPSSCSKIVYAGLYWTGTYSKGVPAFFSITNDPTVLELQRCGVRIADRGAPAYVDAAGDLTRTNTGVRAMVNCETLFDEDPTAINFRVQNDQFDYRYIKVKTPEGDYIDITPTSAVPSQVVYDGFPNSPTNSRNIAAIDMPYLAYADVTSILQRLGDASGTYTVANIKAYTGFTDGGGSAAGWALVVAYEDSNEPLRFLSSYDGYSIIESGGTDVEYSYNDFMTNATGPVRARLGIAALEGEEGLGGDQLFISPTSSTETRNYSVLFDAGNPENNFFNSSITKDGAKVTTRKPASSNTLGFDLDIFDIPNPNNTVLGNNETDVTFLVSTDADQFAVFLNTFAIEVMQPDLHIAQHVEDTDGVQIAQGGGVRLGDELIYVLTVQNKGGDNAINTVITDALPTNTTFISGSLTVSTDGVLVDDSNPDRLIFEVDDDLVKIGDAPFTIRFRVQVSANCTDFRDACSEAITNSAWASYTGEISDVTINDSASIMGLSNCQKEGQMVTNFITDLGDCVFEYETSLCTGEAVLTAANNYDSYIWRNSIQETIGTTQTIVVNQLGAYTVEGVSTDCRNSIEMYSVARSAPSINSPLLSHADNIALCPTEGSLIPEMYLCGDESRLIDVGNLINATSVEWERLDATSCPANPVSNCPITNATCSWVTVGTGLVFTLNGSDQIFPTEGQYRLSVVYENDACVGLYYFNVYQSTLNPVLLKRDIVCNDPGILRVANVPDTGYEFSLDNKSFQESNEFRNITSPGEVRVYVRETMDSRFLGSCTFSTNFVTIRNLIDEGCTLGLDDLQETSDIAIYPNPTVGPITISTAIDRVAILDLNGQTVFRTKSVSFDISQLSSGIYFVNVTRGTQTKTYRVIKK